MPSPPDPTIVAKRVLAAAALYHLAAGALATLSPRWAIETSALPASTPTVLFQTFGLLAVAQGVGYAVAARAPLRHWPIVLAGLLEKVLVPLGFLGAVAAGDLPWNPGRILVIHHLLWWVPFSALLFAAFRARSAPDPEALPAAGRREAMDDAQTSLGWSLLDLSADAPRLVVFLRHFGCCFTRETLVELRRQRPQIEEHGASIVLVHMSGPGEGARHLAEAGLADAVHVSDPACRLYRAFGLGRGSFLQMFGPRMWWPRLRAFARGHRVGPPDGDGFRLPGAFLVFDGEVLRRHHARDAADHPDYLALSRVRIRSTRWIRS